MAILFFDSKKQEYKSSHHNIDVSTTLRNVTSFGVDDLVLGTTYRLLLVVEVLVSPFADQGYLRLSTSSTPSSSRDIMMDTNRICDAKVSPSTKVVDKWYWVASTGTYTVSTTSKDFFINHVMTVNDGGSGYAITSRNISVHAWEDPSLTNEVLETFWDLNSNCELQNYV